jgi:hypothetical protein
MRYYTDTGKQIKCLTKIVKCAATAIFIASLFILSASAIYVIDNLDNPSGWSGGTAESDTVYQGKGALQIKSSDFGDGNIICLTQKQISPIDLSQYSDGYIRFYLYVENEDNLGDSGQFELTSSGTCDVEELTCNLNTLDLHSGWNEMVFSIAELSGSVRLDSINFIRLYMFQSGEQTLILDDISVGSAADFGIGEVAVKEKTVLTLDSCDSAAGFTDSTGTVPAVYTEIKVEGLGAVGAMTDGNYTLTKALSKPLDISEYVKSGYIYLWLYADNIDTLSGSTTFTLRSSEKHMVAWSITGLEKGWNELLLKLSGSNIGSGAIDYKKITSFSVNIGNNGTNLFAIDRVLYGFSRDFGIKSDDDPAETAAAQTDTPNKVTSINYGVYITVTIASVAVILCALIPPLATQIKRRSSRAHS